MPVSSPAASSWNWGFPFLFQLLWPLSLWSGAVMNQGSCLCVIASLRGSKTLGGCSGLCLCESTFAVPAYPNVTWVITSLYKLVYKVTPCPAFHPDVKGDTSPATKALNVISAHPPWPPGLFCPSLQFKGLFTLLHPGVISWRGGGQRGCNTVRSVIVQLCAPG